MYHNETFAHRNRKFTLRIEHDDSQDKPWERGDGRGPVSKWVTRSKCPGEWVLASSRGSHYRYYDAQEAMKLAKKDGWGLSKEDEAAFAQRIGRVPTANMIRAEAVRRDFEFLRGWCNDEWHYVGVVVNYAEDKTYTESVWGIESCAKDYINAVAHELADAISEQIDAIMADQIAAERPDLAPQYAE